MERYFTSVGNHQWRCNECRAIGIELGDIAWHVDGSAELALAVGKSCKERSDTVFLVILSVVGPLSWFFVKKLKIDIGLNIEIIAQVDVHAIAFSRKTESVVGAVSSRFLRRLLCYFIIFILSTPCKGKT